MSNDEIKNNIFYKPKVEIERNYRTEGIISKPRSEEIVQKEPVKSDLEDFIERANETQDKLLQIRKVIDILPDKVAEIIKDIVEKLIFQTEDEKEKIQEIINKDEETEDERRLEYKTETDSGSISKTVEEEYNPSPSFWDDPDPIDVDITVVKAKSNSELAYEQYLKDSTVIKEDFTYKLNSVLQDYLYPLTAAMNETGLDDINYLKIEYEGESVKNVKSNDRHLHDTIVKNQIIVDEKTRKFAKTHGTDTTLATMTAFDITSQQRVKYYEEEYDIGITSFNDIHKRNILEKIRKEYENKYAKAKVNIYKYFNSSAIITGEILKRQLDIDTSKCYLLTQDINIYARERYEATGYQNTTDKTLVDLENTNNSIKDNQESNNSVNTSNVSNKDNKNIIESVGVKLDDKIKKLTDKLK